MSDNNKDAIIDINRELGLLKGQASVMTGMSLMVAAALGRRSEGNESFEQETQSIGRFLLQTLKTNVFETAAGEAGYLATKNDPDQGLGIMGMVRGWDAGNIAANPPATSDITTELFSQIGMSEELYPLRMGMGFLSAMQRKPDPFTSTASPGLHNELRRHIMPELKKFLTYDDTGNPACLPWCADTPSRKR